MSLEEKVGQMFMPHLPDSFSAADIQKYAPAGYVLYAKDFSGKTKAEVQQMIARYQQASKIPLLISADEEGGRSCASAATRLCVTRRFCLLRMFIKTTA